MREEQCDRQREKQDKRGAVLKTVDTIGGRDTGTRGMEGGMEEGGKQEEAEQAGCPQASRVRTPCLRDWSKSKDFGGT